jgi:hypothetical protein
VTTVVFDHAFVAECIALSLAAELAAEADEMAGGASALVAWSLETDEQAQLAAAMACLAWDTAAFFPEIFGRRAA